MDLKKAALEQLMKLMQNERVMKVAMNPRVMGTVMKAMAVRGKIASAASEATHTVAQSLHLATREDVRELQHTVRRLEELINQMESREADRVEGRSE